MSRTVILTPLLLLLATGCGAADRAPAAGRGACLPAGDGYLRAQLRGTLNADLDWRDADILCEGGMRPGGAGLRVSIAGTLPESAGELAGRRLRFVFGIDAEPGEPTGSALPTNVTAIIEGEDGTDASIFATLGDEKCTTDRMSRSPAGSATAERVEAHGFCISPATTLDGSERLHIPTFDFVGRVTLELQ